MMDLIPREINSQCISHLHFIRKRIRKHSIVLNWNYKTAINTQRIRWK